MIIQIGLIGFGTVGAGAARVLLQNAEHIRVRTDCDIHIKTIVDLDLKTDRGITGDFVLTDKVEDVLNDPEIDIVIELIGGIEPARTFILTALRNGKHVVTANKDLIALHGHELLETADKAGKNLCFEGSVGGGIPIIAVLKENLSANRISTVMGIINGTTTYILTAMDRQNRDYAEVLAEAQKLGYAEANPSSDVDGLDAARKLAILASLAFHSRVSLSDVFVEGISRISREDFAYAAELKCAIKLLAIAKLEEEEGIEVRVHPVMLPLSHPLATVNGVFNAVYVVGDAVGETMFYGKGAGSMPTGSAVASDVIHLVKNIKSKSLPAPNCSCYRELPIKAVSDFQTAFYIRLLVQDEPRVLATIALLFAEAEVSFASIIQKPKDNQQAEIVLVTHICREGSIQKALASLNAYSKILSINNVIRFENSKE